MTKIDQEATIESLKQAMQQFVDERNWSQYHTEKNLAAGISIEAAELLELFLWLSPEQAAQRSLNDPEFRQAVGEEMSDVFLYILSLANRLGIDLASAVDAKLEKNRRKYPIDAYYGKFANPVAKVAK
jgi:NTP pyrophosphatase (non-canonical NTP hydrolase)